ncbi:GNAT family N-acetyltransferase [Maribacter sp.]|uniref:GNAT family N-acetyltransferase n=1 Tax=Maribacter sp. TaxID=1897614 RepID=UPI0025C182A7|nr:GNAT family N-acetyltransferase [Maribacter sp.]
MSFTIRDSKITDVPEILSLIKELAVFEKEENAVEVTEQQLAVDGFGENPLFHCFVAESKSKIVGIALVYPRYSTWKGPILHLEDLMVSEKFRGTGLGNALLTSVVKHGNNLGVKRISWEVIDWNERAIAFYESKGANVMRDWDVVHLDEQSIANFLKNSN